MNAVIKKLPALVEEELEAANVMHTVFHSPHEGYAVLLEEVEETHAELIDMEVSMKNLWGCVKQDNGGGGAAWARDIESRAVHLAAEAIQVAAMARKFQAIEPGVWN